MITLNVLKNEYFQKPEDLPRKGSEDASCYDLIAVTEPKIVGVPSPEISGLWKRIDYIEYNVGLQVAPELTDISLTGVVSEKGPASFKMEKGLVDLLVFPRSSISKYNLILKNSVGTIDADFRNFISCRFAYTFQPEDLRCFAFSGTVCGVVNPEKIYKKGDKIAQFRISNVLDFQMKLVDSLSDTKRGLGGFGSTGV